LLLLLLLLLEFEFEFELLLEFEFELLLEFELEFEFESLFEFELLSDPQVAPVCTASSVSQSSSAVTGAARKDVAMKATVATLAKVFIGGFLLYEKQPSVTAQG
jgi:hypothetical protein